MRQGRNGTSEGGHWGTAPTLNLQNQGSWPGSSGSARESGEVGEGNRWIQRLSALPGRQLDSGERGCEGEDIMGRFLKNWDLGAGKGKGFKGL